jgi:hypothetical protein
MVFEAFPLIESEMEFSFSRVCDESCFLDWIYPYSIKVQIENADLEISTLFYEEDDQEDLSQLQYAAKKAMDYEKIETLNARIPEFNMNWTAGDNNLVEMYYEQKKFLFGEAYNILGYEYYQGGVFEFLGHRDYPKVDPDLVRQFDWRDRHGANDSLSDYWDGDTCGTGWLTSVKDQGGNPICYVYGANGVTEALANVFNAHQWDLNLSEQDLYLCLTSPSHGGEALAIIRDSGVVTESCLPIDSACIKKCNPIDSLIKITDTVRINVVNYDSVRIAIMEHGPLLMNYSPVGAGLSHIVTLSGFCFNPVDSTLNWIIKDSYGPIIGDLGFNIMPLEKMNYVYIAEGPVLINDTVMIQFCTDADLDGHYFWGIGPKPDTLGAEAE